jgi:hypothetical protein
MERELSLINKFVSRIVSAKSGYKLDDVVSRIVDFWFAKYLMIVTEEICTGGHPITTCHRKEVVRTLFVSFHNYHSHIDCDDIKDELAEFANLLYPNYVIDKIHFVSSISIKRLEDLTHRDFPVINSSKDSVSIFKNGCLQSYYNTLDSPIITNALEDSRLPLTRDSIAVRHTVISRRIEKEEKDVLSEISTI